MAMRVTNSALYRKYTTSVNEVHSKLNKSMNKISTGAAYEAAADNPLAYYSGKKMDNEYQDVLSKQQLLTDIKNRLYQQELGARSIQETLSSSTSGDTVTTKIEYILNTTNNAIPTTVGTIRDDLIQKQQTMVNDLNGQYESFYIYGGNDLSTTPFSLSYNTTSNEMKLTYNHKFSGATDVTTFEFTMDENGKFTMTKGTWGDLKKAMSEQGRVDVGYGSIHDTDTLLDTYTGGLNLLTGITSDVMKSTTNVIDQSKFEEALTNSAVGVTGQAIIALNQYQAFLEEDTSGSRSPIDKEEFTDKLTALLPEVSDTSHRLGTVYSDLGNKYNLLTDTADRLKTTENALIEQYKDKLGADPYDSIVEMFSYQQSYLASLQVSSNIMRTSLFDFMG